MFCLLRAACCVVRSAWEWAWHLPQLAVKCQQRTTNEQKEAGKAQSLSAEYPTAVGHVGFVVLENYSSVCPFILQVCLSFASFFRLAFCICQSVKTLYLLSTHRLCFEGKVNRKLRFVVAEHST